MKERKKKKGTEGASTCETLRSICKKKKKTKEKEKKIIIILKLKI